MTVLLLLTAYNYFFNKANVMEDIKFLFEYSHFRSFILFLIIGLAMGTRVLFKLLSHNESLASNIDIHSDTDMLLGFVASVFKWMLLWWGLSFFFEVLEMKPIIAMLPL